MDQMSVANFASVDYKKHLNVEISCFAELEEKKCRKSKCKELFMNALDVVPRCHWKNWIYVVEKSNVLYVGIVCLGK